jgi:hypothetical protein
MPKIICGKNIETQHSLSFDHDPVNKQRFKPINLHGEGQKESKPLT